MNSFINHLQKEFEGKDLGNNLENRSRRLLVHDLHRTPFKNLILEHKPQQLNKLLRNRKDRFQFSPGFYRKIKVNKSLTKFGSFLNRNQRQSILIKPIPLAFYFFTRPFSLLDLTVSSIGWTQEKEDKRIFSFKTDFPYLFYPEASPRYTKEKVKDKLHLISITEKEMLSRPSIALINFETKDESYEADVKDKTEPDGSRIIRLFEILNDVLRVKRNIDYVVFPELSIPQKLLKYVANKLSGKGISLIAGISYTKALGIMKLGDKIIKQPLVLNEMIYILHQKIDQFSLQYAIRQSKEFAAIHEEAHLWDMAGKTLISDGIKYLINHKEFYFSSLICNEFLNIDYRQSLRGKIDALFVLEWNKDLNTYEPLVQSTSSDLHAFVIQDNNRKYGDTRVRAPYKEPHMRDIARIRGGELDYFILVSLDVSGLRKFQDNHRSPGGPFKPVPTGYEMDKRRKKY